jgi:hypothetical protein
MAFYAAFENGPAARSFAADAYDCIMVRIPNRPTEYKVAARCAPERRTPLGSFLTAAQSPIACRRARVRQGQAFGGAKEAPSLTATARDGFGMLLVGAGESLRRGRTREMAKERKWSVPCNRRLTSRAPYKACSGFTRVTARRIAQPPKGDLCHEASTRPVARPSRPSASGPIDNYPGEILPH